MPTADKPARPWAALPGQILAFSLLFSLISISLTEGFLFLAVVLWAVWLIVEKRNFAAPTFFIPLLAYAALSLVSSAFSVNPAVSFRDCREMALYLMIPVAYMSFARPPGRPPGQLRRLRFGGREHPLRLLSSSSSRPRPEERIMGFMGHYMTQAGLLALFMSLALAMVLFGKGKARYLWGAGALAAGAALELTLTRSAWIGIAAAACVLVLVWKPKFVLVVPVLVVIVFFASPAAVKKRALSIFTLQGYSNRMRVEYLRAGAGIIRDYPLLGTGAGHGRYGLPEPEIRPVRRGQAQRPPSQHRRPDRGRAGPPGPGGLAGVHRLGRRVASQGRPGEGPRPPAARRGRARGPDRVVVAGFFEYNFGDSEIAILFLYLITMPFAGKESASS